MVNNTGKIRLRVFYIWFLTLSVILVAFAEKISGIRNLSPPFSATLQSAQILIGLVLPQIGVMSAFYFNLDRQSEKLNSLSRDQVTVITFMSVFYHVIFIACVVFGIVFYGFDSSADGNALQRNTAAIVAIMGLFSLFLAPVAFLFASPNERHPKTASIENQV